MGEVPITPITGTEPPGGVDYGSFEFSVKRFNLHALAEQVSIAVPGHATLPVLGCFRVQVSPQRLRLAATDMEITVFAETRIVSTKDEAEAYIPAKKLQAILREAPEGDITIAVKKNQATVSVGSAQRPHWVLKLPDSAGYPVLADPEAIEFKPVSRVKFLAALKAVRHSVCQDAGRPPFTQVSIAEAVFNEGAGMAATASDGNRFARAPVPGYPLPMNIPARVLDHLARVLAVSPVEEAEVGQTSRVVAFRVGPVILAITRLMAQFPDVEKLTLKPALENQERLMVDRSELLTAIRRVRINADTETSAIALVLSQDGLTVVSRDKTGNSASETIQAGWEGDERGGERVLVVNHQFLTDMLAVHPSPGCVFRLGKNRGKRLSMVLLSDPEAGITGVIPQMPAALVGY